MRLIFSEKWVSLKHLLNNSKIDDVIVDVHNTDKLGRDIYLKFQINPSFAGFFL